MDILGMSMPKLTLGFSAGKIAAFIYVFIFSISVLRFNWEVATYLTFFAIVLGLVIDRKYEEKVKVSILTISQKKNLGQINNAEIQRGGISWSGWGDCYQTKHQIQMVVLAKYEMGRLIKLIRQHNPEAFIEVSSPSISIGNFEQRPEVNRFYLGGTSD